MKFAQAAAQSSKMLEACRQKHNNLMRSGQFCRVLYECVMSRFALLSRYNVGVHTAYGEM